MTEECKICYYDIPINDFYDLVCCQNSNRICRHCIELLTVPLCPFCRTRIHGLPDRSTDFRGAMSLSSVDDTLLFPLPSYDPTFHFVNPLDDSYLDSRILRRQMKRLRKLQERERNANRNRRINYMFNETSRRRQQETRHLQEQIREDVDMFVMDDVHVEEDS